MLALAAMLLGLAASEQPRYAVHHWSTRDGLPQNTVLDIAQTPDGAMWMATLGGLARFDGAEFELFDSSSLPALGSSRMESIEVATTGELVVATQTGDVLRWDSRDWQTIEFPGPPRARRTPTRLAAGAQGVVWCSTPDGLFRLDPHSRSAELVEGGLIVNVASGPLGQLAFADTEGVMRLDPSGPVRISSRPARELAFGPEGGLFAARGDEAWRIGADGDTDLPIGVGTIRNLSFDSRGRLCISGRQGMGHWSPGARTWQTAGDLDRLGPSDTVRCTFEDRDGNVWVGTDTLGVLLFSPTPLDSLLPPSATDESMMSALVDADGNLYANGEVLWRLEGDELVAALPFQPEGVAAARGGGLWLSTPRGIERLRGERREVVIEKPLLPQAVHVMHQGVDDRLWIALPGWLLSWDGTELRRTAIGGPAGDDRPQTIFEDRDGRLWVGGEHSLYSWDGEALEVLQSGQELPLGTVRSIYQDDKGAIWVGTYGGGLCRIVAGRVSQVDVTRGLFENVASCLLPDGHGHLVVLGIRAVSTYSFAELDAVADGRLARVHARVFDSGPGIDIFEGNGVRSPRGAVGADGRLYFPSLHGLARFDPERVPTPIESPRTLTQIRVLESATQSMGPDGRSITLAPGEREFQLRFKAISMLQPRQVHVRYQLIGSEESGPIESTGGSISYAELAPGDYTFQIQASAGDGPFGPFDRPIVIHVPPTLLERPIVRLLLGLAALLFVIGLGLVRLRATRLRSLELEGKVVERTGELLQEVAVRERAEASLRNAHEQLESEVAERTRDLARALTDLEWDMRRREELEERLRESERLEAIGRLAGGLAHDFNNILTAMLGETDLAQTSLADAASEHPLCERLQRHLENVRAAGLRAAGLTRQLLAYSRQQVMQPRVVDPLTTLVGLRSMLLRLIPEDVELRLDEHSTSQPIRIDPGQLEQVVVNLVVNAAEAMPKGGTIEVGCRVLEGAITELWVRDFGPGLEPADRTRIFEPFFSTKGPARGLGLASVHGIVLQSGGTIEVDSEPGRGTCFRVALPSTTEPLYQDARLPDAQHPPNLTVLLVDDELEVLRIARLMLEAGGMRVLASSDPAEALALAEAHGNELDVLVTDVVMPGMNGKQLSEAARELCPSIRVLFISGYSAEVLCERDQLGTDANLLPKPFDAKSLIARVAELAP